MKWRRLSLVVCAALACIGAYATESATLGPGRFKTILPPAPKEQTVEVKRFRLDRTPVTNAEFLEFVRHHPKWRRDRTPKLFADEHYLSHWSAPAALGKEALPAQPVTRVSWFAAKAYCEARGAQLPTWHEWEFAAAADQKKADARDNAAWRQRILEWYAQPSSHPLQPVARGPANYYGVHDLHGLIWEWVLDYNALLVSNDSREQGGADRMKFCGEGALSAADRENYAVLMRVAFLSSLEARYTTANLGFRCAKERP